MTDRRHDDAKPADNAFIGRERSAIEHVFKAIEETRKRRDATEEQIFAALYGVAGISPHRAEGGGAEGVAP